MTEGNPPAPAPHEAPAYRNWKFWAGSVLTLAAVIGVGVWAWSVFNAAPAGPAKPTTAGAADTVQPPLQNGVSSIPTVVSSSAYGSNISRLVDPHTDIPERGTSWVTEYVVQRGDTLSGIAEQFHLKWETILWGNTDTLKDDPNFLMPGKTLFILPVDGAFYQWQQKDTLESVASDFSYNSGDYKAIVDAIISWPGNSIDPLNPVIEPGTWIIIPGGSRPFSWEAPMVINGHSKTFGLGPGTCSGSYNGNPGSGVFRWPTANQNLSGYDYSAMHRGIDIYVYMGQSIFAADAGVVVFAGWSDRGYGNLVIIDHLNSYHTFYAHLSQWNVNCGQQVYAGSIVGLGGSTGNSTGPHLHFELLQNGIRLDPHFYLM
jgi:murein DD-endopeptidase MepM/ murein hydrolase activator NlpD